MGVPPHPPRHSWVRRERGLGPTDGEGTAVSLLPAPAVPSGGCPPSPHGVTLGQTPLSAVLNPPLSPRHLPHCSGLGGGQGTRGDKRGQHRGLALTLPPRPRRIRSGGPRWGSVHPRGALHPPRHWRTQSHCERWAREGSGGGGNWGVVTPHQPHMPAWHSGGCQ